MKFLIVFACALAAASAGFVGPAVAPIYPGPQHLPVIGANGVPVDTPAVQQATAAHLTHKVEAHARNGDFIAPAYAGAYAAPAYGAYAAPAYAGAFAAPAYAGVAAPAYAGLAYPHGVAAIGGPAAYPTTAVHPASVNGVPLETPEVVAAKSKHFAAHAEALARNGHVAAVGPIAPIHHLHTRAIYSPLGYSAYGAHAYGAYPYGAYGAYGASPYYY